MGIKEQLIFPEIVMDKVNRIQGMNISFITTANTDAEALALLKEFGLPFKNQK
jgi:large subunit ribosomal protein L5